jgi:hypothetical protein
LDAILIVVLGLAVIYLIYRLWRLHQVMRWWYQRQANWRHTEAEKLRDGTIQSLFGLRRQLELLQLQHVELSNDLLTVVEQCQKDLDQLGDRLFSAYTQDSLLSALRELTQEMQGNFPDVMFRVQGDLESWVTSNTNTHTLLVWIRELLCALLSSKETQNVEIQLIELNIQPQIEIRLITQFSDEFECSKLHQSTTLNYLCQTFSVLTKGHCRVQSEGEQLICSVLWPPQTNPRLISMPFLGTDHEQVSDFSH